MTQLVPYQQYFTSDQINLIKGTICKGATNDELKWFLYQAARAQLDPFSRQIYWVKRKDGTTFTLVSIDGLRLVAQRSGEYAGQMGPEWCNKDGSWHNVWLEDGPPFAARVGAMRKGASQPIWGVARFQSYAPRNKDGQIFGNWRSMPDVMIAKCAEALALRKAFPQDLSGLYSGDEMEQAIPDSDRKLENGGEKIEMNEDGILEQLEKDEKTSDASADSIIEDMRRCKDHTALYAYKESMLPTYWKSLFPPDRERIEIEYKALMGKFADAGKAEPA
jgi:phage recombination protein Bet